MLCFRDMTFCSDECGNRDCPRNWNTEQQKAAEQWWGGDGAPVAFSSFKDDCPDFLPLENGDVS